MNSASLLHPFPTKLVLSSFPFLSVVDSHYLWVERIRKGHQVKPSIQLLNERMSPTYAWKHQKMGKFLAPKSTPFLVSSFLVSLISLSLVSFLPPTKTNQSITPQATTPHNTLTYFQIDILFSILQCSLDLSLAVHSYNYHLTVPKMPFTIYFITHMLSILAAVKFPT